MKTKFLPALLMLIFLAFASIASADLIPAASGWRDITVFDGQSRPGNNDWYGTQEDNEVEWGTTASGQGGSARVQIFDLEAIYYNPDAKQLLIIAGFDFSKFPVDHNGNKIKPGDIFLKTKSKNYVLDISYPMGGYGVSTDYNASYNLYSGNFKTVKTNYITSSPDYKRRSGGDLEGTGNAAFFYDIYNQNSVWNGIANTFAAEDTRPNGYNKHHALVVDLEWLTETNFDTYHTMQCGNDVISGSSVPEPASFFLFGTGLLFFAHRCRKGSDSL